MCHILHTCTLNSSSLSACDTPVGLGLNAAAWMNQGAAYFVSFDPRSPSLTWSCSLSWRAAAATTFFSGDPGGRTCCCKHMDENIVGIGLSIGGLRGQCFTHHYSANSHLKARDCSSCSYGFETKVNRKWLKMAKEVLMLIEVTRRLKKTKNGSVLCCIIPQICLTNVQLSQASHLIFL